jgi:hypothetical protein
LAFLILPKKLEEEKGERKREKKREKEKDREIKYQKRE